VLANVLSLPQEPAVTAAKQTAYTAAVAAAAGPAAKKKVIVPTHATLVVCAVSLVGQWCAEVQSKLSADSALKIHMCKRPRCRMRSVLPHRPDAPTLCLQTTARAASRTRATSPASTSW
jgi:hypothetical protein